MKTVTGYAVGLVKFIFWTGFVLGAALGGWIAYHLALLQ